MIIPAPYSIRLAQAKDLDAIVHIYNAAVPSKSATADLHPVTADNKKIWFDTHQEAHRPMYVLCNNEKQVIAWVCLSDYHSRPAYHISSEVSIYIDPHERGQGLGKILLAFIIEKARDLKIQNLIALIFAHNNASIALFTHAGFKLWGTLPGVCDMETFHADVAILGKKL